MFKKILSHLADFKQDLGEAVKKGKFATKNVFQIMLNEVLKNLKK